MMSSQHPLMLRQNYEAAGPAALTPQVNLQHAKLAASV